MAQRKGKTVVLDSKPYIVASAGVVGKKEGQGPLGSCFDGVYNDVTFGQKTWEQAESELLKRTVVLAMEKAGVKNTEVDAIFAGDLLNQCTSSAFALRSLHIPMFGLYGACSTMALSLIGASTAIESGGFGCCVAATSSHFCSAEKQFRLPLEYGGQRPPTAQWTVTGSGAAVLKSQHESNVRITATHVGTVVDMGITDANNMGAAMAPVDVKIEP